MVAGAALYFFVVQDPIPLEGLEAGQGLAPVVAAAGLAEECR